MTKATPLPIPAGGFDTDEDEARWIEQTIVMRANEGLASIGLASVSLATKDLYELILLAIQAAGKRAVRQEIDRRRKAEAEMAVLRNAVAAMAEGKQSTFRARNGREVGIEADDGEKCWIVHNDLIHAAEVAAGMHKTARPPLPYRPKPVNEEAR